MPSTLIVHGQDEPQAHIRKDGMTMVDAPRITCVGIFDITQVHKHHIQEVMGTISHALYFRNGGHLFYTYGVDGGVTELQGSGVDIHSTGGGMMMVMQTLGAPPAMA